MGASVADDMIRSYFERWQRLEEEKRTISDDLKELFAEARGNGLDTKALRAVFREQVGDKAAAQEFDAICDLYRASLNAPRAGRARTRKAGKITEQPETAEQSSDGERPIEAAGSEQPSADHVSPPARNRDEGIGSVNAGGSHEVDDSNFNTDDMPDTGKISLAAREGEQAAAPHPPSPAPQAKPTTHQPPKPQDVSSAPHSSSVAPPPPGETDKAGDVPPPSSPAAPFDNPRCKSPDGCTFAHSRNSCWECTMAWATRPKDEQVRLWQDAVAASETEVAA